MTVFAVSKEKIKNNFIGIEEPVFNRSSLHLGLFKNIVIIAIILPTFFINIQAYRDGGIALIAYSLVGLITGILVGLFGIGGGSLLTPFLILVLNITPVIAVGSDLFHAFLMKTIGGIKHYDQGNIDLSLAKKLLIGAIPSSLLAAIFTSIFDGSGDVNTYIKIIIAIILIISGPSLLLQSEYFKKGRRILTLTLTESKISLAVVLIGILVGFTMGLTSVGAGVLMLPLLVLFLPTSINKLVGTDILTAVFITAIPSLVYLYFNLVNVNLVGLLLLGSIPGVIVGAKINNKVPQDLLRFVLCLLLLLIGLIMIVWR